MPAQLSRENNFDLLRLVAALQIMLTHYVNHTHFSVPWLNIRGVIKSFSGIAMLFTISGFLIFASFDNSRNIKEYARNRFLRIYPALWTIISFMLIILVVLGYINSSNVFSSNFIFWIITQASFLQFYTPGMLRGFGVGTPNGSFWTIPVEMSFYILVPLFFWLTGKTKRNKNLVTSCPYYYFRSLQCLLPAIQVSARPFSIHQAHGCQSYPLSLLLSLWRSNVYQLGKNISMVRGKGAYMALCIPGLLLYIFRLVQKI
ncbi:MAG: acyltransferase [Luteolibacter sp.]